MREIKFRAWDAFNERMWEQKSKLHDYFAAMDYLAEGENAITFMQFTGLKDKNGVEIYEGDIIKVDCSGVGGAFDDGIYKATYFLPDCGFFLEQLDEQSAISFNECYNYEVIGNIYQNANLLNQK